MKLSLYKEIINCLQNRKLPITIEYLRELTEKFAGAKEETLYSIADQLNQRRAKATLWKHSRESNTLFETYERRISTGERGVILSLSTEIAISPTLLAKIIIEEYLRRKRSDEQFPKKEVNAWVRDTNLIDDGRLAAEISICLTVDRFYSPSACVIKRSVGEEYETFLKKKLRENNIAFLDENVLRKDGYDKTPDIKLEVPIGVNGKVVNWIESKALFADEECHKTYLKEQLWSYWNRFGPGLVIYWFGYVDDLNFQDEKGIQIMDEFPTEFVQPS